MTDLRPISLPAAKGESLELYISEVSPLEEDNGHWGFNLYGSDKAFIIHVVYADEAQAIAGAACLTACLKAAVYIGPDERGT
jgi:hypothetical protein